MNNVVFVFVIIAIMYHPTFGRERSNLDLLEPYSKFHGSFLHYRQIRECQQSKYGELIHELHPGYVSPSLENFFIETKYFTKNIGGKWVKGHYSIISDPLRTLSVLEPSKTGGCLKGLRETVKMSATQKHCIVAMNAGFFNTTTGKCLGNVVSDGRLVLDSKGIKNAQFGITRDGKIFTGYLSEESLTGGSPNFEQLVSGVGWLLRKSEIYISESKKIECPDTQETGSFERFIEVVSARSSVGHDAKGRVILLHVEGKTDQEGASLWDMASIMKDLGAINAINLDGGGSATYVVNGTVVNYPSDLCSQGSELNCARQVTTILCAHEPYCAENCSVNAVCRLGNCECLSPWSGPNCTTLPCHSHNCSSQGECTVNGCVCNMGWTGTRCEFQCYNQNDVHVEHQIWEDPKYRQMVIAIMITSVVAALSLALAVSVLCFRWLHKEQRRSIRSSPVHYQKCVDDSTDVSVSDNEGS